jgi:hypothetical protein
VTPPATGPARQAFAWLWLVAFLFLVFTRSTVTPPHPSVFPLLALSGLVHAWMTSRSELIALVQEHRWLWLSLAVLVAAITGSEIVAHFNGVKGLAPLLPIPVWLVLCLPALTVIVLDPARMRFAIGLFAVICVWHFFTMPIEAVTGTRLSWQPIELFPRAAGPLNYQASGLAWQAYYFPGLFLPLFYLAWGPLSEGRIARWPALPKGAWALLAMAWGLPAVCVQSRSAFAGALAAGLLALIAYRRPRQARTWLALGILLVIGVLSYWYLFSANKSGMDLRWAYYKLYLAEAMKWPALLTGHGFTLVANEAMFVKGLTPLEHSHNDLIQSLYSWGTVALGAYLVFWGALIRMVWKDFAARGRFWPACALLIFIPSTITDLGFQHFEKAAFLMLLVSWCLVFSRDPYARIDASLDTEFE